MSLWFSPVPFLPGADDQYGLSTQHQSHQIAECVERSGWVCWGKNNHLQFIKREEEEEEEEEGEGEDSKMEDEEDGMGHDDSELKDEEDIPFAEPGQEGISVWDLLGEGFLKEATEKNRLATYELILNGFLMFLLEGKLLNESDLTLLCAYTLKVEDGITNTTFDKLHFTFPQAPLDSIKSTEK